MKAGRLIFSSLTYYRKKNLLLAVGIAVSGAVITGAMMVGDSVKYSLNLIVEQRLGHVTHVMKAGDRYFTTSLAEGVREQLQVPVSTILLQEGSATSGGGQIRVNHIQVMGVDAAFDTLAGTGDFYKGLSGDTIFLSTNLARRLNVGPGDEILLRIEKASLIPLNAPFVSDAGNLVTLRASVGGIAGEEQLGRFNLKVSQTAPFNVFISQARLQGLMDFEGRANVMLFSAGSSWDSEGIAGVVDERFSAADAGLEFSLLEESHVVEVSSRRVFIDEPLSNVLSAISPEGEGIVTYFVNSLSAAGKSTPYSFVSTLPGSWLRPGEIIINTWLAEDLGVGAGDSLEMAYFEVGPLRELNQVSARFIIKAVVPMEGRFGDRNLMPGLPGLSDAGNCRDWDTGVPIALEAIRDKDEDYWDRYGGIPKAFISVDRGKELWHNRFGTYTAFRYRADDPPALEAAIMKQIEPSMTGFTIEPTRQKGAEAAGSGVDFSQLFAGLSFFLLLAGILLTVLLFLLNLESREEQLGTLVVLGIPVRKIRGIIFLEALMVSVAGTLAGLALAVGYNALVFRALNGVWKDVVRTEMMHVDIRAATLAAGWIVTLAIAVLALWFPLNKKLRRLVSRHRKTGKEEVAQREGSRRVERTNHVDHGKPRKLRSRPLAGAVSVASFAAALILIGSQLVSLELVNVPVFFSAGGLLLAGSVFAVFWFLALKQKPSGERFDLKLLSWKNATRNRTRSMSIVILFAIGAFLVISTGSNRKDLFSNSGDPGSGTGGFLYYAESTIPVLQQLNNPEVRYETGLEGETTFVQMRKAGGDDASCLNLNKIVNPQVLGVDPLQLENRFSFVTRTAYLDEQNPWASLLRELPGGLIPAVADETVIKWGLGLSVGDTLHYTNASGGSMDLLLVGGLAPSLFQGNVIIANERFLEQFPGSSGTQVFLVEGEPSDTALISAELGSVFRDLGWDMQLASERLAEFNSVTNTYLSIFMVMGALGLLVGTFGLVVVLSRSLLERRREIALLMAVGYGKKMIRILITREYMILLVAGITMGFGAAIIATLPSMTSAHSGTSFTSILMWLMILVGNGWIWIQLVTRMALKHFHIRKGLSDE
ncbi:MAG: ABC transporter permease [Bacteroidota bacterium]